MAKSLSGGRTFNLRQDKTDTKNPSLQRRHQKHTFYGKKFPFETTRKNRQVSTWWRFRLTILSTKRRSDLML